MSKTSQQKSKKKKSSSKKRFVHPNFAIDMRVERKYRKRMQRFMEIAKTQVVKVNPALPEADIHGTALAYVFHKREKCKLILKRQRAEAIKRNQPETVQETPVEPPPSTTTDEEDVDELFSNVNLLKVSLKNLRRDNCLKFVDEAPDAPQAEPQEDSFEHV